LKWISFAITTGVFEFNTEDEHISLLWEIDLTVFDIDFETKMIIVTEDERLITNAIYELHVDRRIKKILSGKI